MVKIGASVARQPQFSREPGLWAVFRPNVKTASRPAVFVDRDGVLIRDTGYIGDAALVALIPGVAETVARINQLGIPIVVVTNQSGIARGKLSWFDFAAVEMKLHRDLMYEGAKVDAVIACAYHEDGQPPLACADHHWRKPNPGMLLYAAQRLDIDLGNSVIVGDKISDLLAGQAAGLLHGVLVDPHADVTAPEEAFEPKFNFVRRTGLADACEYLVACCSS